MKGKLGTICLCCILSLMAGCKKDKGPSISAVHPGGGGYGMEVSIVGSGFSTIVPENHVQFNGKPAFVLRVSGDTVVAEVPKGAGSGPITVMVDGKRFSGPVFAYEQTPSVSLFAGGAPNWSNGYRRNAGFTQLWDIAVDGAGTLYAIDRYGAEIRKITANGFVTSFAGGADLGYKDGVGSYAMFNAMNGLACDAQGNVYVADTYNHRIRKVTPLGEVTSVAGNGSTGYANGSGTAAKFHSPADVVVDAQGNMYVTDRSNHRIRKITPNGTVSSLAGSTQGYQDGAGENAQFSYPSGIAIDAQGNLYVTEEQSHRIRKVTPAGVVSTFAGGTKGDADGTGTAARFNVPTRIAADAQGNVYVTDRENHRVRKISPNGVVTTYAGTTMGHANGKALEAMFNLPFGIAVNAQGVIYVADQYVLLRQIVME